MSVTIGIPQALMLACYGINLVRSVINHGKQKDKENAFVTFLGTVSGILILAWGGFFS